MLLTTAINKMFLEHKRIQAKKMDEINEKFSFRVWLVRLGLNALEVKAELNSFYENLTGHKAFSTKKNKSLQIFENEQFNVRTLTDDK